jgi:hypothetical protein
MGNKVDSGIGLPMVHVLEPTLGEVLVNSGIGSHTPYIMFLVEYSLCITA